MFKGFHQVGNYGLTRKVTNAFGGYPSNSFETSVLNYSQIPNLVGWFASADGITTATGVSAWVDRISGASLAQSTAAAQPTYSSQVSSLNGRSKITFAATQFLSAGDVFDVRTNTGYTICWYGKVTSYAVNRQIFGKCPNASAPTVAGEYRMSSSGTNMTMQFFDDVSLKTTGTYVIDLSNYYLYTMVIDITAASLYFYVNENIVASTTISSNAVDYNNGSSFLLGNLSTSWAAEALEILIYQTALSKSDITQNINSLRLKFGLI